ncbi:site-specific integrase [Shewanella sp. SM101]|jgi:integrase|uniref:Site-specific integrase n=1 Tax=Shewanella oncorhynchi TaxID=2726434 RepID=A0AA50Q7C2_9GAMM|nr:MULTISPECIES: site-specific integrase [Shewanella]MCS6098662.1 site-specific integrase [Shewanella baltica]MCS6181848.1 site-specific integrase [Shewanella baltica]MCU8061676.1 site-specific integrase [Shewanella sp. SM55]MCU8104845.1 site-specific integrase [Shewanella sp. SM101]MDT3294388.1 site-specific integrase [Shewanella sp. SP2S2-6]
MSLSDTWLKANLSKSYPKSFERADRDGLSVRVSPKGKITFQIRYRYVGKACRVDLGSYPLMSLKDARTECVRLRAELEQGNNPKTVKELEHKAVSTALTMSELFMQWYESYCVANKTSHAEILRSFKLHVLPKIGHLPADKVSLHIWLDVIETKAKTSPSIADRLLTNGKQLLKWGVKRQLLKSNVLVDISAKSDLQITKNVGDRSLNNDEIRLFWLAIEGSRIAQKNKIFLKLNLIYGCRNGELRLSKKSDFDFNTMVWTVPPENHKTGKVTKKPLLRPIIPETKELIEEAVLLSGDGEFLFNNEGTDQPMGRSSSLSLPYNIIQWLKKNMSYEMEHWSIHDLRKTARTNFSTLTEPHVAEIMLGHKLPGQWQVYDHYEYLEEQANAYSGWVERLRKITA